MSILTPELIAQYQSLDGPSVSNAIESFDIRLRNEGFAGRSGRAGRDHKGCENDGILAHLTSHGRMRIPIGFPLTSRDDGTRAAGLLRCTACSGKGNESSVSNRILQTVQMWQTSRRRAPSKGTHRLLHRLTAPDWRLR